MDAGSSTLLNEDTSSGTGSFHDIEQKSPKPDEQHVPEQPESQLSGLNVPSLESPRNNASTSNTTARSSFSRLVSKMKLGQYEAPGGDEAGSSGAAKKPALSFFQVIKAAQMQKEGHEVNLDAHSNWANVKSSIVERVISLNRASTVTATEAEEEVVDTSEGQRASKRSSSSMWDTLNLSAEQQEDMLIKERQMKIEFDAVRDGSDLIASGDVFLDPRSPFRESWDKLMFGMIFYTVCNIPYDIAFVPGFNRFQQSFELVVDILFIFDILLNFFTAYYDNAGLLVARRKLIIKNYLNNWFTLDFLAAFPLEWISPLIGIGKDNEQAFALLKVTRLLRFGRVFKAASKNHNSDTIIAFRIFQLIGSMCLVSHWLACVWFFTCDKTTDPCSIKEIGDNRSDWYLESYYTGILAMMGDGLDDLSKSQKCLAVLITLMGNFILAVLFGGVANLVQQMNLKQMQHNAKVSNHNDMMQYMNMPKSMQERVRQYFEYVWLRYRDMDGGFEGFASSLPASLNEEVMRFLNMKLLVRAPFFKNLPPKTQQVVAEHVQTVVALPGQVLLKRGSQPQGLFFILRGKVELLVAQNNEPMAGENETPRSQNAMAILAAKAKEAVSREDIKAAPMNQVLSAETAAADQLACLSKAWAAADQLACLS
ncbi:hypothetical protein CYMTET_33311 [Cymbomonas tetramitiformis]|uniref:Cyclic nucleotide-binding domain-containing protein n=1 Tax=Cymbomonas tetramitiformis TaxID=36881 RepID=A0AAE0KRB7_9CHLO|nr:hypothetical protein CYMTET_33311 [Cymbomonas tetramitiformis]